MSGSKAKILAGLVWLSGAGQALAHAAEQGFVLLLPTTLYIICGTAAVACSLVLVSVLSRAHLVRLFTPRDLGALPDMGRAQVVASLAATLLFAGLIYVGFKGPNDPVSNLLPLTIWTVWWIGLVVVQGVLGDVWRWINPWTGLYHVLLSDSPAPWRLPARLGVWPAVVILLAFNGFALADIAPNDPDRLARFALGYWLFTLIGMALFGGRAWLGRVECFTVFFTLIARLAPLQLERRARLGFPGWAALEGGTIPLGMAAFCLVLLGSGSFDGLHETFWWLAKIGINPLAFPGRSAVVWPTTLGLLAGNVALIGVFTFAVWLGVKAAAAPEVRLKQAVSGFAITLLPIAFGYHIAHFLTAFMVQIQYTVVALADPLATGANLMGLGARRVTTGFLNTQDTVRIIWLTQGFAVVASHILSVLMAHNVAHRLFATNRQVIAAQLGIGLLMILYTIFGLWLLASPRGV